jgi:hypothetical protein
MAYKESGYARLLGTTQAVFSTAISTACRMASIWWIVFESSLWALSDASSLILFADILRKIVNVRVKMKADTISTLTIRRPEMDTIGLNPVVFIAHLL